MRRILLLTAREYRRMVTLPAFWMVALIVPVVVIAVPLVQRSFGRSRTAGLRAGGPIRTLPSGDQSACASSTINGRCWGSCWHTPKSGACAGAARPKAQAPLQTGVSAGDSLVETFVSAGGATAALRGLKPRLSPDAPPFQAAAAPAGGTPPAARHRHRQRRSVWRCHRTSLSAIHRHVQDSAVLDVAVYIPADVDSGGQVRVWASSAADAALVQDVRRELTDSLRLKALQAAGVDPLSAARIETLAAPISIALPETGTAGTTALTRSRLPLALAYLLLVSMMITGSMMLQGLVEERANKLLEAVLACVTPRELMFGKLVGISAIGLSIVGIWVVGTIAIVKVNPSSPLGFLIPALASVWQTPVIAAAMIFYFLAGFLTIGMIFLAIALVCDNMQEAQAYLMPVTLLITAPSIYWHP